MIEPPHSDHQDFASFQRAADYCSKLPFAQIEKRVDECIIYGLAKDDFLKQARLEHFEGLLILALTLVIGLTLAYADQRLSRKWL